MIMMLSSLIIPFVIFVIVGYGIIRKTDCYDCFVNGAKDGMKTVASIAPTLVGLMIAVGVLRASGFLEFLSDIIGKFSGNLGVPSELVPLIFVRLFSTSAATGLALDIFKQYGTDSYLGLITSLLMSCTETVFYTMSVYFMAAKVKKTRWTLPGALVCTAAGIIASIVIAKMCM